MTVAGPIGRATAASVAAALLTAPSVGDHSIFRERPGFEPAGGSR